MQTLTKADKAPKVARSARRHLRLARRTGNAAARDIAERVAAPLEVLEAKIAAAAAAQLSAADAFDDYCQDDEWLDRDVRSAHRKCVDWDTDHPGSTTTQLLYQGRAVSQITKAPREKEPDLVADLVARGASLPPDHPALPVLARLTELAAASRAGNRAWVDARQRAVAAEAERDIARIAVIRIYRDNAIDIARAVGDDLADDCFPTLRGAGSRDGAIPEREPDDDD